MTAAREIGSHRARPTLVVRGAAALRRHLEAALAAEQGGRGAQVGGHAGDGVALALDQPVAAAGEGARGHRHQHELGEEERGVQQRAGVDRGDAGEQDDRRDQEAQQALRPLQEVQAAGRVLEPLREAQAALEHRRVVPEHLERALGPAAALHQEGPDLLGRDAQGHHLGVEDDPPAGGVQPHAGVGVLDDRVGGHAADREDRAAAEDRRAAAPEGGVVAVLPARDRVEEDALLVAQRVVVVARVLEAAVVEVLGRLDDGDLLVGEVAEHPLDQLRARHVVGVEGDDELRVHLGERVVDVAGLRVAARRGAREVADAELLAHQAHPWAPPVVEHPHLRGHVVADRHRADDRRPQDVLGLVVGGDEDGDRAALQRRRGPRGGRAASRRRPAAPSMTRP